MNRAARRGAVQETEEDGGGAGAPARPRSRHASRHRQSEVGRATVAIATRQCVAGTTGGVEEPSAGLRSVERARSAGPRSLGRLAVGGEQESRKRRRRSSERSSREAAVAVGDLPGGVSGIASSIRWVGPGLAPTTPTPPPTCGKAWPSVGEAASGRVLLDVGSGWDFLPVCSSGFYSLEP